MEKIIHKSGRGASPTSCLLLSLPPLHWPVAALPILSHELMTPSPLPSAAAPASCVVRRLLAITSTHRRRLSISSPRCFPARPRIGAAAPRSSPPKSTPPSPGSTQSRRGSTCWRHRLRAVVRIERHPPQAFRAGAVREVRRLRRGHKLGGVELRGERAGGGCLALVGG